MKAELLSSTTTLPALKVRFAGLVAPTALPTMSPAEVEHVAAFQRQELAKPQAVIQTRHILHAGLYSRTIMVPEGLQISGALVKIPTLVIVSGDCYVWLGDGGKARRCRGYHVLPASAGRKQAFRSLKDTYLTMVFATKARTVEDCEKEFTDEWEILGSRRDPATNHTTITGE